MPSVLLGGLCASDPAGSRAVRDAVLGGLPNHHVLDLSAFRDPASVLNAAHRSSGIVMAGASFGSSRRATVVAAAASAVARRPLALVGITTGPLEGPLVSALVRWAAGRADLLLLADTQSASYLAATGAPTPMRVSADPAWLALAPTTPTAAPAAAAAVTGSPSTSGPASASGAATTTAADRRGESVVVVLDGRLPRLVERSLGAALVTVARAGRPVRLVPWCGANSVDAAMASRLARAVNADVPAAASLEPGPATMADAAALCSDAHAVVTFRYRAVHAAAAAGVPVVGTGADPRTAVLASRLGQPVVAPIDLPTSLPITLERIGPESVPSGAAVQGETDRALAGMRLLRLVFEPDAVGPAEVDHLPLVPVPWL